MKRLGGALRANYKQEQTRKGSLFMKNSLNRPLSILATVTISTIVVPFALGIEFNDGGTHTINDATYQDDIIAVSNGTTVVLEPGAVLNQGTLWMQDTTKAIIN